MKVSAKLESGIEFPISIEIDNHRTSLTLLRAKELVDKVNEAIEWIEKSKNMVFNWRSLSKAQQASFATALLSGKAVSFSYANEIQTSICDYVYSLSSDNDMFGISLTNDKYHPILYTSDQIYGMCMKELNNAL